MHVHNTSILNQLLQMKKGTNITSDELPTRLHTAASSGSLVHVKVLLDHGDKVNDSGGSTPLHVASAAGHADIVQLFLDHGAVCNLQDGNGNTALHVAHNVNVATLLLSSSSTSTVKIPNKRLQSPLHVAASR